MTQSNFLQSEDWKKFQELNGRNSISLEGGNGFLHTLPIVGKYVYFPRCPENRIENQESGIKSFIDAIKKLDVGWARIEPETDILKEEVFRQLQDDAVKIVKAPHDMQPRENFVIDISKSEENLLLEMKSKTRYNVRLAEKKSVKVFVARDEKYREDFFRLIDATARRQKILPHPRAYYEKMFEVFGNDFRGENFSLPARSHSSEMVALRSNRDSALAETMLATGSNGTEEKNYSPLNLALFVAEYQGEILAANLVLLYGNTMTYLHGGTSDEYREVMAPILLQWEQIKEAKRRGCVFYDFGGVKTMNHGTWNMAQQKNEWEGITRFKMGFSPETRPVMYPGCYDIILDSKKYWMYDRLRHLQTGLSILKKFLRK